MYSEGTRMLKNEKYVFNSSLRLFVLFNRIKILARDKKRQWMSVYYNEVANC
jgi:hypothetical protein